MWFLGRPVIAILVLAALLAAGYAELVLDVRAPRSELVQGHVVSTEVSATITNSNSQVFDAAMKARYGPKAVTSLRSVPVRWVVEVDDKVVHEQPVPETFAGAFGFFLIGARGKIPSMFPFRLDLEEWPLPLPFSLEQLRDRFQDAKDPRISRLLAFNDAATAEGPCTVLEPSDLGSVGRLLRLRTGRFCLSDWTGLRRGSALIGAVLADGDPWMRPFTGRICRSLTTLALRKIATARSRPPEYAACLLIDRPTRGGANDSLRIHVYEVGAAGTLAVVDPSNAGSVTAAALAGLE